MKINPLTQAISLLNRVQSKGDGGSRQESRKQDPGQQSKKDDPERVVTEQEANAAVEAFKADPQTQASGLSASTEGTGPGLRVVLKDSQGSVIRQFSAEEFLRLRESVSGSGDSRARGKILDQKM